MCLTHNIEEQHFVSKTFIYQTPETQSRLPEKNKRIEVTKEKLENL